MFFPSALCTETFGGQIGQHTSLCAAPANISVHATNDIRSGETKKNILRLEAPSTPLSFASSFLRSDREQEKVDGAAFFCCVRKESGTDNSVFLASEDFSANLALDSSENFVATGRPHSEHADEVFFQRDRSEVS